MEEYWKKQLARLGKNVLFLDTGAIVGVFERDVDQFSNFFDGCIDYRFVTSTYVVAETVRRLVKSKTPDNFLGPNGEKTVALALHVLRTWLDSYNVAVLCIPEDVFNEARRDYPTWAGIQCDLTDVISLAIVRGLNSSEIVTGDGHFQSFGLRRLP